MKKIHVLENDLKTLNGESLLGDGDINIEPVSVDASTLTEEQLSYLRDKQIKFGMWTIETKPLTLVVDQTKLPIFFSKTRGNLSAVDKTTFKCLAGKLYEISYSVLATMSANGSYNFSLFNDTTNTMISDTATADYTGSKPNTAYRYNLSSYFLKFDEDTNISLRPYGVSGNITSMFGSRIKIAEIDSFDVSLKNFKINGKNFDENNNIDLEGIGTMSNPKLDVETLTEYRHPVNGKPVYAKTIDFGSLPNATTKSVDHGVVDGEDVWVDETRSLVKDPDGSIYSVQLPYPGNVTSLWTTWADRTHVIMATGANRTTSIAILTILYTKTTDTAESPVRLAGGAGKSAYELWLEDGNTGTLSDFMDSIKGQRGLPGRPGRDGTVEFELLTELQKESLKGESQLTTMESGNLIKENINEDSLIINKPLAYNSFDNETFNIYGTGDNKVKIRPTNLVDRIPEDTDEFQIMEVDIRSNPFKDGSVVSRFALESDLTPSVGDSSIDTLTNNTYSFKEVDGVKYLDTIIATKAAYMKSSEIEVGTSFTINFKFKPSSTVNAGILHFKNIEVAIWSGKIGYVLGSGLKITTITPVIDTWYDVTVSVNGTDSKIYIDGELETTGGGGGYSMVVTNYIGLFARSSGIASPFVGGIRGIRILNRSITDEEAKMLYIDAPEQLIALYHGLGEVATKATVNHHTINLKAPTFKSADDAREYGLEVGDIYIEVDTLKVLLPREMN